MGERKRKLAWLKQHMETLIRVGETGGDIGLATDEVLLVGLRAQKVSPEILAEMKEWVADPKNIEAMYRQMKARDISGFDPLAKPPWLQRKR
jgi:hypothetical protein